MVMVIMYHLISPLALTFPTSKMNKSFIKVLGRKMCGREGVSLWSLQIQDLSSVLVSTHMLNISGLTLQNWREDDQSIVKLGHRNQREVLALSLQALKDQSSRQGQEGCRTAVVLLSFLG